MASKNNGENGSSWGGFSGLKNLGDLKMKNLGESIRSQAEELNSKAKEAGGNILNSPRLSTVATATTAEPVVGKIDNAPPTTAEPIVQTTENDPTNVKRDPSKEELMIILQKMSKKVKVLSTLRLTLIERVKTAEKDKGRLMSLVKDEILTEADLEDAARRTASKNAEAANKAAESDAEGALAEKAENFDEIAMMHLAWRAADEKNQMSLQQLQNEYKVISMQCQADVEKAKAASEAEKTAAIEKIRAELETNAAAKESEAGEKIPKLELEAAVKRATEDIEARNKEAINSIRSEMEQQHKISLKKVEEEFSTEKNTLVSKIMDETSNKIEKLEAELAQKVQDAKSQNSSEADSGQIKILEEKEQGMKVAHKNELKRLTQEIALMSNQMDESEMCHVDKIKAVMITHSEEIHKLKDEASINGSKALASQEESYNANSQKLQITHEREIEIRLEQENARFSSILHDAKESHANEIEKMEAEKEKVKGVLISNYESETHSLQQSITSQHDAAVKEIENSHEANLEKIRTELKLAHNNELDRVKAQIEEQMTTAQNTEIENLNGSHLSKLEEMNNNAENLVQKKIDTAQKEVEASLKEQFNAQILEIEGTNKAHTEEVAKKSEDQLCEIQTKASRLHSELEQSQSELSKAKNEIETLQQSGAHEIKQLKEELEKRIHEDVEKNTQEVDSAKKDMKQTLQNEHALALEKLRDELTSSHNTLLEQSKINAATQLESLRNDLTAAAEVSMEDALSKTASAKQVEIAQVNSDAESRNVALEEERNSSHEKSLKLLKQTFKVDKTKLKESIEKKATEQINKMKVSQDSKLTEMMTKVDDTSQLLEDATNDQDRLRKELEHEKSTAVSAAAKFEAMSAAVKDGNSTTDKKLEEAMSKQSASFENEIQSQKERHEDAINVLQEKCKHNTKNIKEKEESLILLKESIISDEEKLAEEKVKCNNLTKINFRVMEDSKKAKYCVTNIQKELVSLKEQQCKELASISEELKGVCIVRDEMTDKLKSRKQEMTALTNQHTKSIETMQGAQEIKVTEILKESASQLSQVEKTVSSCTSEIRDLMNAKTELLTELDNRQVIIGDLTQAEKDHSDNADSLSSKVELMRLNNEELSTKLDAMTTSSQSSLDRLKHEKDDVLAEVKRLQEENDKTNAEHIEQVENLGMKHRKDILSMSSENESATSEVLADLEKKCQDTNSNAKKEIASLNELLEKMSNGIVKTEANHEMEVKKLQDEATSTVKEAHAKMNKLQIERDEATVEHQTQLEKMQTQCNGVIATKLSENKNMTKSVAELKKEFNSIKSADAKEITLLKDSIQNANNEIEKIQAEYKTKVEKLQHETTSELAVERKKILTLTEEKDCVLLEHSKELQTLEVKHSENIASRLLATDSGTHDVLEKHKEEMNSARSSLAKEIASLQDVVQNSKNENKNMRDQHQCEIKKLQDESASSLIASGDEHRQKFDSILVAKDKKLEEIKFTLEESLEHTKSSSAKEITLLQNELQQANSKIENIRNEYNNEVKKLHDTAASNLSAASDKNSQVLQEKLDSARTEKEKEWEELKLVYEAKMKTLDNGKMKALDIAKKMKEAYTAKLTKADKDASTLKNKFEAQVAKLRDENDSLRSDIQKEVTVSMNEVHAADISSLTKSFEEKIKVAKMKYDEELATLKNEKCLISDEMEKLHMGKVKELELTTEAAKQETLQLRNNMKSELEKQIEAIRKEHQDDRKRLVDDVKINLQENIKAKEKEHAETNVKTKQKMSNHIDELKKHYETKIHDAKNELNTSRSQLGRNVSLLEQKLYQTQAALTSLTEDKETLQENLKQQITVEISLGKELENLKKDSKEASATTAATTTSLLEHQEKLTKDNENLKHQVSKYGQDISLKINNLEEKNGMLKVLQTNLNSVAQEKKTLQARLDIATKQVTKLNATETELGVAREEVNRLKLYQAQSSGLLSRLQSEKDASEKNHGQRTALVGMLEAQLSELNDNVSESRANLEAARYDLSQKDDELKDMKNELEKAEKVLSQNQLSRQKANDQATQNADKDALKKARMVDNLQRELQLLQQQMARKSSAAQRLLQERESECKELRKRSKALQQELDKGSLSDRRIFELAAQQSNRESVAALEIDIRNTLVEKLTHTLASRDGDLASVEYQSQKIESKVEDLCRIRRREDINVDYLKSIIVQYLSKPPGSSERNALLPVIATLLQFDQTDYKLIEEGKDKVSWFGSVLPTRIQRAQQIPEGNNVSNEANGENQASPLLSRPSAEDAVLHQDPIGTESPIRTSLQF